MMRKSALAYIWGVLLSSLIHAEHLILTALLSDPNGNLRFECWELEPAFTQYPTVGKAVPAFADVSNISWVTLPARSSEGFHKPPHPMLFVLLSGLAHVTIPGNGDEDLWIAEGDVMIAADTIGKGHVTDYPLDRETHALQIPFKEGVLPSYRTSKHGVCHSRTAAAKAPALAGPVHVDEFPLPASG